MSVDELSWNLLIGFAFFDDDVSIEEKILMVIALIDTEGSDEPPKRISPFVSSGIKGSTKADKRIGQA